MVALLLLAAPAPAAAAERPLPSDVAAVDAYRESIPTASGPQPTGRSGRRATLDESVVARLGRLHDDQRRLLEDVATSPAYGAPVGRLRADSLDATRVDGSATAVGFRSFAGGADNRPLVVLGGLLAAISTAAVVMRIRQRPLR
jgi:hypothetical protein